MEELMLEFVRKTIFKMQLDPSRLSTMQFLVSKDARRVIGLARWLVGNQKSSLELGSKLGRGGRRKVRMRSFLTQRRRRQSL